MCLYHGLYGKKKKKKSESLWINTHYMVQRRAGRQSNCRVSNKHKFNLIWCSSMSCLVILIFHFISFHSSFFPWVFSHPKQTNVNCKIYQRHVQRTHFKWLTLPIYSGLKCFWDMCLVSKKNKLPMKNKLHTSWYINFFLFIIITFSDTCSMLSCSELLANGGYPHSLVNTDLPEQISQTPPCRLQVNRECEGLDLNSQRTDRAGERLAVILQAIREDTSANCSPLF